MATRAEQETTVTAGRDDAHVMVYTSNPVHLRRLRNDSRAVEVDGGEDWARFRIPSELFDPLKGFRRKGRVMSEEERKAAAARLAAARLAAARAAKAGA